MIHITMEGIEDKVHILDNDFNGHKFEALVEFKGKLNYYVDDFEVDVFISLVRVVSAKLDGEELSTRIKEVLSEIISERLVHILTICTDGSVEYDKDSILDECFEVLKEEQLI